MSLYIIKNGLLDTLQDTGRYGYQHLGINPGGAMDTIAIQVANALLGNDMDEAVLEMHFPAAEVLFEKSILIALSGADISATIDKNDVPILQPVWIRKGSRLYFGKQKNGPRVYMGVRGGYAATKWLQSSGTNLKVKAGGFAGRALQKNDRLLLKQKTIDLQMITDKPFMALPWKAKVSGIYTEGSFHFIPGAEYDGLNDESKQKLETGDFLINQQSDRMGYRLEGETLSLQSPKEMISTAVTKGTMQLLPDGQLIVLMADHQTTGGYPRVGHVISADIPSLAQIRPGEKIGFTKTNIHEAENLLLKQQRSLQQLQNACNFRLQEYFNL